MLRSRTLAATAAVLALALTAACGSDEPASSPTEETSAAALDSSTLDGACRMLLGPDGSLVDDALAAATAVIDSDSAPEEVDAASIVQNELFEIVTNGPERLQDSAGTIVDYLDDPAAYETSDGVVPDVTAAVEDVRAGCEG